MFRCDQCPQWFRTKKSLGYHSEVHQGRTRCPVCQLVLSRKFALKRHLASAHPGQAGADGGPPLPPATWPSLAFMEDAPHPDRP